MNDYTERMHDEIVLSILDMRARSKMKWAKIASNIGRSSWQSAQASFRNVMCADIEESGENELEVRRAYL